MLLCSVQYMAISSSTSTVHPLLGLGGGSGLKTAREHRRLGRVMKNTASDTAEGELHRQKVSQQKHLVRTHNLKLTPLEIAIEPLMDITGWNWGLMNPTKVSTCYRTDALITKDLVLI